MEERLEQRRVLHDMSRVHAFRDDVFKTLVSLPERRFKNWRLKFHNNDLPKEILDMMRNDITELKAR
jgi:hypothetical protein